MKLNFNRHMLTKTSWDSGYITPLSAMMHRFAEPGRYQAEVQWDKEFAGRFGIIVDEKCPETAVNIDLDSIDKATYIVNPKCYTVFQAPRGRIGCSVVVSRVKPGRDEQVFDSRELQSGDIYIAALLQPGDYTIVNRSGARGHITVVPPEKGKLRPRKGTMQYAAPEAVQVECTEKWFRPDRIRTESGQSLSFMIRGRDLRIRIDKEKIDERQRRVPRRKRVLMRRRL